MATCEVIWCIEEHIKRIYSLRDRVSYRQYCDLLYLVSRMTDLADYLDEVCYREYLANN